MNKTLIILTGITVAIIAAAIVVMVLPAKTEPSPVLPEPIQPSPAQNELIKVTSPLPGDAATSPLVVTGEARGPWYFEASFPIDLVDAGGTVLAQGYAEAQGEWMTEEFVPFVSVPLTFAPQPAGSTGRVVLHKANASGLPEHDRSISIPVVF